MTMPTLPVWWPPSGYEELSEAQVRELFAYLRTVVPDAMEDAKRRIRERVGDDDIRVIPGLRRDGKRGDRAAAGREAGATEGHAEVEAAGVAALGGGR